MEEIKFVNKIWIKGKGRFIDRFSFFFSLLYIFLSIIQCIFINLNAANIAMFIFCITISLRCHKNLSNSGLYIPVPCRLIFFNSRVDWFYDSIDLQDGRGNRNIHYVFQRNSINKIQLSKEMKSIRMECEPEITVQYKNEKLTTFTEQKRCILVIYDNNVEKIGSLFESSTGCSVESFK